MDALARSSIIAFMFSSSATSACIRRADRSTVAPTDAASYVDGVVGD